MSRTGSSRPALSRALAAEALGSGFLLTAVVGSASMGTNLAGGNLALALLVNAMTTGAALYVLITVFGPVSGAHFNPAVTLVFALRREIAGRTALAYVAAQTTGAVLGTWAAHAMFGLDILQVSSIPRSGPALWFSELLATFGLMLTIFGGLRHAAGQVPALVGLYIAAAYWFTSSTSFANPSATLARALTGTAAGILPADTPAFTLAQIAGALIAAFLLPKLFPR